MARCKITTSCVLLIPLLFTLLLTYALPGTQAAAIPSPYTAKPIASDRNPGDDSTTEPGNLQVEIGASINNTKNLTRRKPSLKNQALFDECLSRGKRLMDNIDRPFDRPALRTERNDAEALEAWGWEEDYDEKITSISQQVHEPDIKTILDNVGIKQDKPYNVRVMLRHDNPTEHEKFDGGKKVIEKYPATRAWYCNFLDSEQGVIFQYSNFGPKFARDESLKRGNPDFAAGEPLPKLQHWSDLVFLSIARHRERGKQMQKLKYVLIYDIQESEGVELIQDVMRFLGQGDGMPPAWPGKVLTWPWKIARLPGIAPSSETQAHQALVGGPNISGIAYLLVQHWRQVGMKKIEKITIWNKDETGLKLRPCLLVELKMQ